MPVDYVRTGRGVCGMYDDGWRSSGWEFLLVWSCLSRRRASLAGLVALPPIHTAFARANARL